MTNKKIQGIIVGPTNVGKTSLLEKLKETHGINQISLGALTREGGMINLEIQTKLQDCLKNKLIVPA
jgi:adenylate kinase family enzyme